MHTEKSPCFFVLVLSVVSIGLGVYKAATLGAVSNDSVAFIEFAERLKTDPAAAIQSNDQHPGFPAGILLVQTLLNAATGVESVTLKVVSGQLVNLLSRTVAAGFLYAAFLFFTTRKAAFFNALAVLLIAVYAENGSDVLSDWTNLMFMSVAFFCCLKGLTESKSLWFLAAGVASGMAYWIRPEGLFLVPVTGLFVIVHMFGHGNKSTLIVSLLLMTASALAVTAPYMLYKGKLVPKKYVGTIVERKTVDQISLEQKTEEPQIAPPSFQPRVTPSANPARYGRAVLTFFERIFNSLYLMAVPLLLAFVRQFARPARLRPQDRFLALFVLLWFLMMLWLYDTNGYMSHRHLMPLLIFSCAWLYTGTLWLTRLIRGRVRDIQTGSQVVLAVCLAVFVPRLATPSRTDKAVYREAGVWLSENTPPDTCLLVFDNRIGFYACRAYTMIPPVETAASGYMVLRSKDQADIPSRAVPLKTGDRVIDERIQIYSLTTP